MDFKLVLLIIQGDGKGVTAIICFQQSS